MNRRHSRIARLVRTALARLWQVRRVLLLVIPYFLLFGWLFSGDSAGDLRPGELYGVRDLPAWRGPDKLHWFGTAANGTDLFELSRLAMATSVSVAVVSVSAGIGLALLVTMLFVFDPGDNRFDWPDRVGRAGGAIPAMVVLVILTGASDGGLVSAIFGLIFVVALHLCPVLSVWFREGEEGFDIVASRIVGLSRREIVLGRVLPTVLRRLPGVFATLVPLVVLAEMSLSFLGFTGDRLSIGAMVAYGQVYLIEAPWMAIYPGIFASAVVIALSLLGWRVSVALRTGSLPRIL